MIVDVSPYKTLQITNLRQFCINYVEKSVSSLGLGVNHLEILWCKYSCFYLVNYTT